MYISFVQNLKIWQCSVQNLFSSKGTKFFEDIFLLFFIENDYKWLKIYIPPQYRMSTTKFTLALLSGGLKWIFLPFKNNTLEFTDTKILHFSLSFKLVGQTSKFLKNGSFPDSICLQLFFSLFCFGFKQSFVLLSF